LKHWYYFQWFQDHGDLIVHFGDDLGLVEMGAFGRDRQDHVRLVNFGSFGVAYVSLTNGIV
jgi:hypothetical protein